MLDDYLSGHSFSKTVLAASLAFTLAACGGGGGSGSGGGTSSENSSGSSTDSPEPNTTAATTPITPDNYVKIASLLYGSSFPTVTDTSEATAPAESSTTEIDGEEGLVQAMAVETNTYPCDSGTVTNIYDYQNTSGFAVTGDSSSAIYEQCYTYLGSPNEYTYLDGYLGLEYLAVTDSTPPYFNGIIRYDFQNFTIGGTDETDLSFSSNTMNGVGTQTLEETISASSELMESELLQLHISSDLQGDLILKDYRQQLTNYYDVETLSDGTLIRLETGTFSNEQDCICEYNVPEFYVGEVTVTTDVPFSGNIGSYPNSGQMTFTDSLGSQVTVSVLSGSEVEISYDVDGDGSSENVAVIEWGAFVDAH